MHPSQPFNRNGLARLQDLLTSEWQIYFQDLELLQADFLAGSPHPPTYVWPKNPLHTWSRVWEYPYVLDNVRRWRRAHARQHPGNPVALDFGSGVTFFPFALAREGFNVICVDQESLCAEGISRARRQFTDYPGEVTFLQSSTTTLPLESASVDLVYSISVLEHLPDPSAFIDEFARILRPAGALILTFDIAMDAGASLGLTPTQHADLLSRLGQHFEFTGPNDFVHPSAMLTTSTGPYPSNSIERGLRAVWKATKEEVLKPLMRRPPATYFHLTCEGLVASRRATDDCMGSRARQQH